MRHESGSWEFLCNAYEDYLRKLEVHRRCDFAHLQMKFLIFLDSAFGSLFLNGDGSDRHPKIKYVMVDEYQDTNPIQEAIYLKLAESTHNLCVVGDDDQALYRFRGGTVDCMVTFDKSCNRFWGTTGHIEPSFLNANYRSHPNIVDYYDSYITSFRTMRLEGARVAGKPSLNSRSEISGNYPTVAEITERTIAVTANTFARFVRYLLDNNIIQQPNQCALLMRSVKETARNAGPFADALRNVGIQPYNPRSRTFLQQEEIMIALGAFISIIDPNLSALPRPVGIRQMVNAWIEEFQRIETSSELSNYVNKSKRKISSEPIDKWLGINILEIFYRILAREPFTGWENDPERSYRLGKLSQIFETYASLPYQTPGSSRGNLRTSTTEQGDVSFRWRQHFYYSLIGLLVSEGLNDPEDEEIISPPNRLPIMTVHQAKGLEFNFVFVYGLNKSPITDSSVLLEDTLSRFRQIPPFINFTPNQRAEQDLIRFYYVAYSRAQHALIHLVPRAHYNGGFGFIGQNIDRFRQVVTNLGG